MKTPLLYAFEVCLCCGVLLGLYRWLFECRVPFRACRIYLLAAVAVSALIPALHIPVYPAAPVVFPSVAGQAGPQWEGIAGFFESAATVSAAEPIRTPGWPDMLSDALLVAYAVAVFVLVVLFAMRLAAIARLRRQARLTRFRDFVLAEHAAVRTPFSFLRTVYLGEGFDGSRRSIVLRHETSHVRHRHSVERVAMEAMLCVLWFNPFAWVAARRLREVQEWEADRDVLDAGCDLTDYRTTLFSQLFGCNPDMTCGLSHSFTKKRFLMMTRNKWGRFAGWRLAAALPFVGGLLCLCGFTARETAIADDMPAVVRIAADGSMTFNGREVTESQLFGFVAAEREKLAAADRNPGPAKAVNPQIFIGADGAVSLNGDAVTLAELETNLKTFRAGLSAAELADVYAEVSGASSAPMAVVTDVQEVLRRVPLLRLHYRCGGSSASRILAPAPGGSGKVRVIEPVPDQQNDLVVWINEKGQVMVELSGSSEIVPLAELSGRISDFVEGRIGHAERKVKSLGLPDGRTVDYPVSRGVVWVVHSRYTPYDKYVSVQQAVTAGFGTARDVLAREWFGKHAAALTDAERQLVWQALPIAVLDRD